MQVKLVDLSKTFLGSVVAVDKLNLTIADGEFIVFVGPSGCGKTTTLRMVAGLEQPDEGFIYIGDREVVNLAPKDRNLAMVFQNFSLFPSMNIYDNIAFPLQVLRWPKADIDKRVKEVAKLVGVENLLDRKSRQVSGGQAQRVALARAMVRQPDVFLMDEPLSAIDAKVRVQLRTEIKQLHQETNITSIYVTHDQEEAMTLGDRIVVMDAGKIQQVGTPHQIFHKPQNIFVATFVGSPSMNIVEGRLSKDEDAKWMVVAQDLKQPAPQRYIPYLSRANVEAMKWGIRPEHIKLTKGPEENAVSARISVVEPLGSRDLLFVQAGNNTFKVMAEADVEGSHKVGSDCYLCFPEDFVHLFDAGSGVALN
jgi:multiple sugar transport system ATP-binding protein